MADTDDERVVREWLNEILERDMKYGVAADPEIDNGNGVPREMWDGVPDNDGRVSWKPLPTTLDEDELSWFEKTLGHRYPPLFRSFLLTYHIIEITVAEIQFVALLPDKPLEELRRLASSWEVVLRNGLIPFGIYGGDFGYLYFDTNRRLPDGDCPIVVVDRYVLPSNWNPDVAADWTSIQHGVSEKFSSFRSLMSYIAAYSYEEGSCG